MSRRARVLQDLSSKVGFPVLEAELSPALRKRVGELETSVEQYDWKTNEVGTLDKEKMNSLTAVLVIGVLGVILFLVGLSSLAYLWFSSVLGIGLLTACYLLYQQVREKDVLVRIKNAEIRELRSSYYAKVDGLSQDVFNELSALHDAKGRPVTGSQSQLIKETILREVVMIPCLYCRGLMPQTSVYCPNCGAQRKG